MVNVYIPEPDSQSWEIQFYSKFFYELKFHILSWESIYKETFKEGNNKEGVGAWFVNVALGLKTGI